MWDDIFKPTCLLRHCQKREKVFPIQVLQLIWFLHFVPQNVFQHSLTLNEREKSYSSRRGQTAQQKIIPVAQNSATTSVLLQAASIMAISVAKKCRILKSGFGLDQNMNAVHLSIFPSLGGENIHIRFWDHISSHNSKEFKEFPGCPLTTSSGFQLDRPSQQRRHCGCWVQT